MRRPQQAAEPRGRYAAVFFFRVANLPSLFLLFVQPLPGFHPDCRRSAPSIRHQKRIVPWWPHLFVVCAARPSVSSAPQTSQVTFRHRTTPAMCSDRWQMSLLKFLAPFVSSFSQLTGLNQLRQRLAEEIRSVTPSCISLECVVLFIFCCYLYGPSVTLLLQIGDNQCWVLQYFF